ncbi:MAG: c-type cytochrome [Acidobacteriota bacterium]|nr:c-type cytochrome [Acidobacteriota bacterium]
MRLLVVLLALVLSLTVSAQEEKKKGPNAFANPKNLKVLPKEGLQPTMAAYRVALGVMCNYCHVQGDFASDDNRKKNTARNMIRMTADINSKFPDGKAHVSCFTCHRGAEMPIMAPPAAQ